MALLGLAGSATAMLVVAWLAPVLIAASVLLLGRSFYILYVQRRGTRAMAVVTWLSAVFVVGYWTWRLTEGSSCPAPGLPTAAGAQPAQGAAKEITNSIGMKLVLIPAGKFQMGSPVTEAERDPEELRHEVVIARPFYLGAHEVTQGQWQRVLGKNPAHFKANPGGADYPVEQVRWPEAVGYCKRLSELAAERQAGRTYRLPTEAEWEYACRAGTATVFHFGDALSTQANCNGLYPYGGAARGPYLQKTAKVGSYAPNAWGLYDMHGNVAEWCADFYDPDYYKNSPKEDPKGPEKGVLSTGYVNEFFRVVRGGCWLDEARGCRAAYRFRMQPSEPYRLVGFRVVCVVGGG